MSRIRSFVIGVMFIGIHAAFAGSATRTLWLNAAHGVLIDRLCSSDEKARRCFGIDLATCRNEAQRAFQSCVSQHGRDLPDRFNLPADGEYWMGRLAGCAEPLMENALRAHGIQPSRTAKGCDKVGS